MWVFVCVCVLFHNTSKPLHFDNINNGFSYIYSFHIPLVSVDRIRVSVPPQSVNCEIRKCEIRDWTKLMKAFVHKSDGKTGKFLRVTPALVM